MTSPPQLDADCSGHFTYRDFIECGETQKRTGLANLPRELDSYQSLSLLGRRVLDPVWEHFGPVQLTYGFSSPELIKEIAGHIAPKVDQHAAHERNSKGNLICDRLGAACDFRIEGCDMLEVAKWIYFNTKFDRLYFYGSDRPVHVSYSEAQTRQFVDMPTNPITGRRMPRVRRAVDPI